jgi:hypothetical protein
MALIGDGLDHDRVRAFGCTPKQCFERFPKSGPRDPIYQEMDVRLEDIFTGCVRRS